VEKREEMAAMSNDGTADLVNARNIHLDVVDGEHGWGILPWWFVPWRHRFQTAREENQRRRAKFV
jgi:hypothetical protein